jgi:hypothetical protein
MAPEHSTAPSGPIEEQRPVLSYAPGMCFSFTGKGGRQDETCGFKAVLLMEHAMQNIR